MAKLHQLLDIRPGLTALIGSGGKTSLLYALAGELQKKGRVVIATTTHIHRPEQFPLAATAEELSVLLAAHTIVCAGTPAEDGKLTAPGFPGWDAAADYTLVEADGAHGLPLKAHASHEPVIPPGCGNVICVVGASGFDKPIAQAVHRPERFLELTGLTGMDSAAAPELAAAVIAREGLCSRVFINQTDALPRFFGRGKLREFARCVEVPVVAGSLRQGLWEKLK